MQTIDEIRIESDEDGWQLIVYDDAGERTEYRIGLPDQFKAEVDKTIGAWLAEGELVKAVMRASADGYDKDDPHHPMWHDTMSGHYDEREGK